MNPQRRVQHGPLTYPGAMRYAAVLLLLVLCGCSGAPSDPPAGAASAEATADPVDSAACEQVRAGIAAFNQGDYEETVARFVGAVPLAEEQVDGSVAADELLEAVRWYAALPAERYLAASRGSAEFERYKQVTLGQCMPVGDEPSPTASEPGVEA